MPHLHASPNSHYASPLNKRIKQVISELTHWFDTKLASEIGHVNEPKMSKLAKSLI
jgi:hypothetical protein